MVNYQTFLKNKNTYDLNKLKLYINVIKKTRNQYKISKYKLLIFYMMSKIVIKNINNFFNLIKNYKIKLFYNENELISESYIVFDKCLNRVDRNQCSSFYFFYNTALNRHFIRLIEKNYKKHFNVDSLCKKKDDFGYDIPYEHKLIGVDYYLHKDSNQLTRLQKKILISKLNKQKVVDFLKINGISQAQYYNELNIIKENFKYLRDEK